jgi:hypothetical protein
MKFKTLIIGLFVFAFTASAHAQHAPNTSRHQDTAHRIQSKKNADAISKRKAYNMKRKNRKVTVGKQLTTADRKRMKKENAVLNKKHNKASRKAFQYRKVETAKF